MLDLSPEEKIVLKVRRHKIALFFESAFLILFVILPPAVYAVSKNWLVISGSDDALFLALYFIVLLFSWVIFFMMWTNYYLDVLIVTDKRIVDIEQRGFFSREVATVRLENIEDITINVSGVLATFVDFGTLRIQTAAESREFIIRHVPKPSEVKAVIYDLQRKLAEAPKPVQFVPSS